MRFHHGVDFRTGISDILTQNQFFLLFLGVIDDHFQHETVHLSFGQRIGAFLLDGVLRGHDQERVGQLESLVADGHLVLLHGFEQSALHLGRRTVDFVCQHEVGEDGAATHHKLLFLLTIDQRTDEVGRQQVRSELDAGKVGVNSASHRLDGQCLGQSRHTFKQDVAIGQKANQQSFGHLFLSDDDLVHFEVDEIEELTLSLDFFVQFANVSFYHCMFVFVVLSLLRRDLRRLLIGCRPFRAR